MQPRSLSLRTDLLAWRRDGKVVDRGDYLVIETPSNPGYYWGNLLVFSGPPAPADVERWPERFRREFGHQPAVRHMTLAWDTTTGEMGAAHAFVEQGFQLSFGHVFVLTKSSIRRPVHFDAGLRIAAISSQAEWQRVLETKVRIGRAEHEERAYRDFVTRRLDDLRGWVDRGGGAWFGAFLGERMVGDAGLFFDGTLGRFQEVETHPEFRRRGVCATLIFAMASWAFSERGADQLVIVADDDQFCSASVYRAVGAVDREQIPGLCRYPGTE